MYSACVPFTRRYKWDVVRSMFKSTLGWQAGKLKELGKPEGGSKTATGSGNGGSSNDLVSRAVADLESTEALEAALRGGGSGGKKGFRAGVKKWLGMAQKRTGKFLDSLFKSLTLLWPLTTRVDQHGLATIF